MLTAELQRSCRRFLCFVSELNAWVLFLWWDAKIWPVSAPDHQPQSEVYYHVRHSSSTGGADSFTCTPLSLKLSLAFFLPPSVSPSLPGFRHRGTLWWWVSQMELKCLVPQLSPMQIALSTDSIAENSQQSVLFDAFSFFVVMSLSVAWLPLLLMFQTVIFSSLSLCLYLLQVYQYSYLASYSIYNINTR